MPITLRATLEAARHRRGPRTRRGFPHAVLALLVAVGIAAGCARTDPVTPRGRRAVYPVPEWQAIATPQAAGWTQADLDAVRARLEKLPTTGFMAVAGGRTLMQYGDVQAVSYLASVRKSVLAILFGNYVASGKIRLNKTLAALGIDDVGGLTPGEKQATIKDLLTARSGIYHPASNAGDDLANAPPRGSQQPGSYFLYSNWDFNALGTIFEKETGRDIYDALESDLARPLGMQDFDRASHRKSGDARRSQHLAYHMNLSTRDMARIGYLMLREGAWAGKQITPREWVHEISRAFTPVSGMNPPNRRKGPWGYGYLWWVWDGPSATGPYRGAYTGLGAVGQHITVIPVLDLVVAHKTRPGQDRTVSHTQYLEVLDALVQAGCRSRKC
jgi:CubicO group peptidase (beta-lactamase class C family)